MSLGRPRLVYCSSICDPCHQEYENKLESVQRRVAKFVCIDFGRQSHVSDMQSDLNWKTLVDRRKISRLTLIHKSVLNIVAINIDEHYANHEKRNTTTRKTSFTHPSVRKNCCRYYLIPRTVAEWNRLFATMREAPSVDTYTARLQFFAFYSFYQIQNCLITSDCRHTRAPATVYPVYGDLIVVLDRNRMIKTL